jgi:hypothetical protein
LYSPSLQLSIDTHSETLPRKGSYFPQLHPLRIRTILSDCLSWPLLILELHWNMHPRTTYVYHIEGPWPSHAEISLFPHALSQVLLAYFVMWK